MSDEKLRKLVSFQTAGEADALKIALAFEGIPCLLANYEEVANLGYIISDCEGITVQVTETDWDAAQAVLDVHVADAPRWICPACQTSVEAGFEVCWQCGAKRGAH